MFHDGDDRKRQIMMMKKAFAFSLAFCVYASPDVKVFANAGIFGGFGQDVTLESNANVQMVSEEVIMIPGRARFPVDGGASGLDMMEYHCQFHLRNLTNIAVKIQAGFPLMGSDNMYLYSAQGPFNAIANFKFLAGDEQTGSYAVRYVKGDKGNKFRHVFLWDMVFAPKEEK